MPSFRLIPGPDETFRRRIEVWSHVVPKNKVIPFPRPVTTQYGWVIIILECGSSTRPQSAVLKSRLPRAQPESLRVESRFLKLNRPAKLGERIDGWRVCRLCGWDKSRVLYKVQVDRVVRGGPLPGRPVEPDT